MKHKSLAEWKKSPFIRIVIPFMAGISISMNTGIEILPLSCLFASALLFILIFSFCHPFFQFKQGYTRGIAFHVLLFSFGGMLLWKNDMTKNEKWFGGKYKEKDIIIGKISEAARSNAALQKYKVKVIGMVRAEKCIALKGKMMVYYKSKDPLAPPGSLLVISKTPSLIAANSNPGGFDYHRYAFYKGITHQVFSDSANCRLVRKSLGLENFLFVLQSRLVSILQANIKGKKEQGLAEAMLIGYKENLDKDLIQAYSNTGVVHIIAISGLHLGLIYWLLALLLKPLKRFRSFSWLYPSLIIALLWIFSFLSGGQPSVLRSALMFSSLIISKQFSLGSGIYNSLACSAFILLAIDPYSLWDLGFQFSYAAVLSILIFQKPINNLLYFPNRFFEMGWKAIALTISAQLLTTPISIYHFHQFPNYFLIANLIAVPLSSLILIFEIMTTILDFFHPLSSFLGEITTWLIRALNQFIEWTSGLPFALWKSLNIDNIQTFLLFAGCFGLKKMMTGKKTGIYLMLFSTTLLFSVRALHFFKTDKQSLLIVYHSPKNTAVDIIEGRSYFPLVNAKNDPQIIASRNFYRASRIARPLSFEARQNFIRYRKINMIFIWENEMFPDCNPGLKIDLVLISGKKNISLKALVEKFRIGRFIFDNTVPEWKINKYLEECQSLGIPSHNLRTEGAFVMKLN
jgi:competence protein ComEC